MYVLNRRAVPAGVVFMLYYMYLRVLVSEKYLDKGDILLGIHIDI